MEECFACSIKSNSRKGPFSQQYCIEYSTIQNNTKQLTRARDLDVIVDSTLTTSHKAAVRSRPLLKSFTSRDKNLLIKAFCVYVRPLLEYSSQIWNLIINTWLRASKRFKRNLPRPSLGVGQLGYQRSSQGIETQITRTSPSYSWSLFTVQDNH